jgi:hypothetical protein
MPSLLTGTEVRTRAERSNRSYAQVYGPHEPVFPAAIAYREQRRYQLTPASALHCAEKANNVCFEAFESLNRR